MSRPPTDVSGRAQTRVLLRTFLGRFFEHEATAGRTELRESFFWLVAALAAPGLLFAFYQQFNWHFVAMAPDGGARLRAAVLSDKTIYLTLTSVVMGLVSAAVWNALVVDRRDALILGVLPVRRRAIVAAKLLSLGAYVGALNIGMHTGAAVLFGIFLGVDHGWMAMARGVAAHLVAASAAGMFVFGSVVALQSACLAIAGPRRFARAGAALQVLLVAVVTTTLLVTPALSRGAMSIGDEAASTAWLSLIPPIWFLGLYETLAGTASSGMRELARTATIAVVTAGLAVVFFYPIACWRVLTSAVAAGAVATRPWTRSVGSWNVRLLATKPGTRAALQFLIATAGRVSRFRLVLSAAVGLGLTLVAPIALYWMARGGPARPQVSLLAVPLLLTIALVAGLRVIVAMPSELAAGWMFRSTPLEGFAGRVAARRLLFVFGVLAPIAMAMPVWVAFWGMAAAWPFVVNTLLAGGILVEAHLWGFAGVPCTRPMAVSDSNLQGRWPFYAIGLLVYGVGIPGIEAQTAGHWSAWLLTIVLLTAYFVLRTTSDEAARINVVTDYQRGLLLLDLARVPQAAAGARPAGPMRVERGVRS